MSVNSKPKVALFSTTFLNYSQTFIYDEIMNHKKFDVEVFSKDRKNFNKFPYNKVNYLYSDSKAKGFFESLLYQYTTFSPTFFKHFESGNFDLIHAHFGTGSVYALVYALKFNLPLVVTFHGYDVPVLMTSRRFKPRFWRYWFLYKKLFNRISLFLAASNELKELLIKLGAPEKKVKVWRLGVSIPSKIEEKIDSNKIPTIIMIGRFTEKKGFEYGLKAFANCINKGIRANLKIVGDGELKQKYEQIINSYNIKEKVHFLGALDHESVFNEINKSDILVAPSVIAKNGDRESGILVVKEANARGIPAIGTLHGGIPEIIDHEKTGYLVLERNVESLTDCLMKLIKDPDLRQKFSIAARKKMQAEYNIIKRVEVLEKHYEELL